MSEQLWTPAKAQTLPRAGLPEGDVRLADGRLLKLIMQPTFTDEASGTIQHQNCYRSRNGMAVIASMDATHHGKLLHVSLSYAGRLPSWEDIRQVRDAFYPETVDVMMVLPRSQDYVNLHAHTMHLWQTPQGWGIQ